MRISSSVCIEGQSFALYFYGKSKATPKAHKIKAYTRVTQKPVNSRFCKPCQDLGWLEWEGSVEGVLCGSRCCIEVAKWDCRGWLPINSLHCEPSVLPHKTTCQAHFSHSKLEIGFGLACAVSGLFTRVSDEQLVCRLFIC